MTAHTRGKGIRASAKVPGKSGFSLTSTRKAKALSTRDLGISRSPTFAWSQFRASSLPPMSDRAQTT